MCVWIGVHLCTENSLYPKVLSFALWKLQVFDQNYGLRLEPLVLKSHFLNAKLTLKHYIFELPL